MREHGLLICSSSSANSSFAFILRQDSSAWHSLFSVLETELVPVARQGPPVAGQGPPVAGLRPVAELPSLHGLTLFDLGWRSLRLLRGVRMDNVELALAMLAPR